MCGGRNGGETELGGRGAAEDSNNEKLVPNPQKYTKTISKCSLKTS